jgi:hypothetical protein
VGLWQFSVEPKTAQTPTCLTRPRPRMRWQLRCPSEPGDDGHGVAHGRADLGTPVGTLRNAAREDGAALRGEARLPPVPSLCALPCRIRWVAGRSW